MSEESETPFDSIEGSYQYVDMLSEAIVEARRDVEAEVALAEKENADRRKQGLLLVSYNLAKLEGHITTSRRLLNDLRTLRRVLMSERKSSKGAARTSVALAVGTGAGSVPADRGRRLPRSRRCGAPNVVAISRNMPTRTLE